MFNQTSLVSFDGRNTINFGIGARHISDDETVIVGANVFYDYEMDSEHKRNGFGVELLTSLLELRANNTMPYPVQLRTKALTKLHLMGMILRLAATCPTSIRLTSTSNKVSFQTALDTRLKMMSGVSKPKSRQT